MAAAPYHISQETLKQDLVVSVIMRKNFFSTSNRQKREHELAQIFFLWKHCMSLFNLDSLTAWKIIPWKLNKYHGNFCFVQEIERLCNPTVATRGHQEVRLH